MAPTEPRPKGEAKPATKADQVALAELLADRKDGLVVPEGSTLGAPEGDGIWRALVDDQGDQVLVDGKPIRVP